MSRCRFSAMTSDLVGPRRRRTNAMATALQPYSSRKGCHLRIQSAAAGLAAARTTGCMKVRYGGDSLRHTVNGGETSLISIVAAQRPDIVERCLPRSA